MADVSKPSDGLSDELCTLLELIDAKALLPSRARPQLDETMSPDEVKEDFRELYNELSKQLDSTQFGSFAFFLNFGYVADESPQFSVIDLPKKYINKNAVKLILEVIGDCDLRDRRILDVGCGRGGTIHVIHEFFQPGSTNGIDLSANAIQFCQKKHKYAGVTFEEGDAEKLPFADSAFDVVLNVESSHSYPDRRAFYTEVFRVLVPGGYFLYTDSLPRGNFEQSLEILRNLGFEVERDRDITNNVLRSCDQIAFSNARAFRSGNDARAMNNFLAIPGSSTYEEMKSGASVYRILKLRK